MRRFFIGLFIFFCGSGYATAQTLHALILADTKDGFIGSGCAADIRTMQAQINTIGAAIHYAVQLTVLRMINSARPP